MQQIIELRKAGRNLTEIALATGCVKTYIAWSLRRVGMAGSYHVERDTEIIESWQAGNSYLTLQTQFSLSHARIRQIIAGYLGSGEMPKTSTRGKETA
jgi:hypothetical protein